MKIIYNNTTFYIHWPKHFDTIIISAAKRNKFKKSNFINWEQAEANGHLKGLPTLLSLHDISHRFNYLKNKHKPKNTQTYKPRPQHYQNKKLLFKNLPTHLKTSLGWKPKTIWSPKQKQLLITLTTQYKKIKSVNWTALIKDPRINQLPYKSRLKLMKYYGQCINRSLTTNQIIQKRKDALNYKHTHYKKYLSNNKKRHNIIKNSINNFLLSNLTLR